MKEFKEEEWSDTSRTITEYDTTGLAGLILQYIASRSDSEEGEITFEQALEVFADEFPEFVMLIAEENFMRGYHQGLTDAQAWLEGGSDENATQTSEEAQ